MRRNKTVDKTTASQVHESDMASDEEGRVMRMKHADYEIVPFPTTQRVIVDLLRFTEHKRMMHVLTEIDVTTPRQVIHEQKARGAEPLSFTAFIAACLGKAVDEDKAVQAYRKGRNQLVLFQDVDISIMVEHEVEGHKFPLPYVVRAANHKTAREIHQEIRAFQKLHTTEPSEVPRSRLVQELGRWSGFRRLFWRVLGRSPFLSKRFAGTCGITAVGMFGKGVGWGLRYAPILSLFLTLGGISEKPGVVDGHIAIREYLCLTVDLNHDSIDGAPAARFVTRLKELIESGFGLLDQEGMAEQAST
jgi:pyruvate/2-oxoglutarate dehydrogenase complex dihydrolipoamide acyltransferase (E2) component